MRKAKEWRHQARIFFVCVLAALTCALGGCGGAAHSPANSPAPSLAGAADVAGDAPKDVLLTLDLAGMRADKMFSVLLTKAEASGDPAVVDFLKHVDHVDLVGGKTDGKPAAVMVLWGHFPKQPSELSLFAAGSPHALTEAAPLASGVREFSSSDPSDHLFAVSDTVWVAATGSGADAVRAHFASSKDAPAAPQGGDFFHVKVDGAMIADEGERSPLPGIDHAETTITAGTTSIKILLGFKDEDSAKQANAKLQMIAGMVLAAAASKSKDCAALQKINVDPSLDGSTVTLEIKGIGDAAQAWDPAKCPKVGGDDEAVVADHPMPIEVPAKPGKHRKH
ncbi:MAG: hypothetical protein ABI461_18705 [Polyangiaceae bacterium]